MGDLFNRGPQSGGGSGAEDISTAVVTLESSSFAYDGTQKVQQVSSVVLDGQTLVEGRDYVVIDNKAIAAGTHTLRVLGTLDYGGSVSATWSIAKASIAKPIKAVETLTYDGSSKSPTLTGFDDSTMVKSGDTSGTDAGDYNLTVSLADPNNYKWSDDSVSPINIAWSIGKRSFTKPAITSSDFTYSPGTSRTPTTDSNFKSAHMTKGGDTSKVNAGTYALEISLNDTSNNMWADESTDALSLTWKINKAQGSISVNPTSLSIQGVDATDTSTVTKTGDGNVSVRSSASGVATASISGDTVTVTGKAGGSATISVILAEGDNYTGATATIDVTVVTISNTLNDNSWATISQVSQAGDGDLYWDVGDAKAITVNGKVGANLTLTNRTMYVFILGFNHKDNNVADNNIMWGCFRSGTAANSVNAALYDSKYSPDHSWASYTDGTVCMTMNHKGNYNYGGWKACDLRYDILGATSTAPKGYPAARSTTNNVGYDATAATLTSPKADTLLAALPSDLRAVMRLRTHYCDNTGNSSNTAANVTSVVDAISLFMEYEVFGARSYANQYEKDKQAQFAYFANGNSKKWYKYDATGTELSSCWLGSPDYSSASGFCISREGSASDYSAYYAFGVPAAFKT